MKKEELSILVKSLVPVVKKIIQQEARKIMKPLIKEAVEAQVNKILAEQFLSTISSNKRNLTESFSVDEDDNFVAAPKRRKPKKSREQMMRDMGIDEGMQMFYEDYDTEDLITEGQTAFADPEEGDGEGISLAALGLSPSKPFVKF